MFALFGSVTEKLAVVLCLALNIGDRTTNIKRDVIALCSVLKFWELLFTTATIIIVHSAARLKCFSFSKTNKEKRLF